LLLLATAPALGQYRIGRYTIDGGGGTSSRGPYTLAGTIGRPDVGSCAAGIYELLGGFRLGAPIIVEECLPSAYSTYNDWVALGKPECWCRPYQCDGDADGLDSGFPFNYRVFIGDLALVVDNWRKKIEDATLDPCADIDHKDSGFPFHYRVFIDDLAKVVANWKKKDAGLPGNCPRPE
jgi:hypothetical protein